MTENNDNTQQLQPPPDFAWNAYKFQDKYYIEIATKYVKMLVPYDFIKNLIVEGMEEELKRYNGNIPTNEELKQKIENPALDPSTIKDLNEILNLNNNNG